MLEPDVVFRSFKYIFWGIILSGFKIGGINLPIGMFLVCLGIFSLAKQPGGVRQEKYMLYVKVMAILFLVEAIFRNFPFIENRRLFFLLLALPGLVAIHIFCLAMRDMCEVYELSKSLASWKITQLIFAIFYGIPMCLLYLFWIRAMMTGNLFDVLAQTKQVVQRSLWIAVAVCLAPLIHFFISTTLMSKEIKKIADDGADNTSRASPEVHFKNE